jgi:tetratricopeptide (TPR) repeat protein
LGETQSQIRRFEATGWRLLRAGNPRGAMREFKAALGLDAESREALTGLAQCHLDVGELKEARGVARELLRLAPESAMAHRLMAEALRRKRERREALTHAQQALKLDPFDAVNHHILALVLFDMRDLRWALDVVRKGREVAPDFAVLAAQEALITLELRGGKAAEPLALEAMRMAPDDEYVLDVAARVKLARGDLDEARQLTTRILQHNANDEEAISIYLLSDRRRYTLLRAHTRFPYWKREHGVIGWTVWLVAWTLLILVALILIVGAHVPGLVVGLAYRWFWVAQYNGHRAEVKRHFSQPKLRPGF